MATRDSRVPPPSGGLVYTLIVIKCNLAVVNEQTDTCPPVEEVKEKPRQSFATETSMLHVKAAPGSPPVTLVRRVMTACQTGCFLLIILNKGSCVLVLLHLNPPYNSSHRTGSLRPLLALILPSLQFLRSLQPIAETLPQLVS